eukprot:CAMPEP_0113317104 /NCGR_PEP_ID=MMETSP0010_2-20120614/12129_1 /TAXON_ID=216773 ORGANISM="Corethron hystrix, Strain 308" /NCGR_SAMPLE_ID=MMETSP0010_2 /ASSEMBLY_ACC=CAM_ASM_000155 /LENGTH=408 /DNA_ID=CAMNT_0000173985 /DNA_START=156 /DNA_END=1382 /DNA_ORIENTATION=+ /assembly_acc=CAM_ASM_000155
MVVYTGDGRDTFGPETSYAEGIVKHVSDHFHVDLKGGEDLWTRLSFVHVRDEYEAFKKKSSGARRFTLVMESIYHMVLAYTCLKKSTPDIFFDTTGSAFTFIIAKYLFGCKIFAYVHYPTISTDMLCLVWKRRFSYMNAGTVSSSQFITYVKMVYYILFGVLYGLVGSTADVVMVNSNWTKNHIRSLWKFSKGNTIVLYPPCDTDALESIPLKGRENMILSIGQFRPEKDHALQLKAFALFLNKKPANTLKNCNPKLVLLGSCRGPDDEDRIRDLRKLAEDLGVAPQVEFVINCPFPELRTQLSRASVGLHTMWNEHFGIGVVEMMAAGCVTVAHDSGGPKEDIIERDVGGMLASSPENYADAMNRAHLWGDADCKENVQMRKAGRERARRFSNEAFEEGFLRILSSL